MRKIFRQFTIAVVAAAAFLFSSPGIAQEQDIGTLQIRMDAAEQILLQEMAEVEGRMAEIAALKHRLVFVHNCHFAGEFTPEKQKICNDLIAEISLKSLVLISEEDSLREALQLYTASRLRFLGALELALAPEPPLPPSEVQDPVIPRPPAAQTGIIARLISVAPCVYGSGGRPSERSHFYCQIEYTLTNETDKAIHFTAGTSVRNHSWEGGTVEERIGYGVTLQPGRTLTLVGRCTVPHDATHGYWHADGTGEHRDGAARPQFDWHLEVECTAPPPQD